MAHQEANMPWHSANVEMAGIFLDLQLISLTLNALLFLGSSLFLIGSKNPAFAEFFSLVKIFARRLYCLIMKMTFSYENVALKTYTQKTVF